MLSVLSTKTGNVRKLCEVINTFTTMIVVMVSWVSAYMQTQ